MTVLSQKIAHDFSRAAQEYDTHAYIQRQVSDALLDWMKPYQMQQSFLDLGAGTGYATQPSWQPVDIAQGMCGITKTPHRPVCADMQSLPFIDNKFDGVFSSLAAQWLPHPLNLLLEAHRTTHSRGELYVSTLSSYTFQNLRQAFKEAELFVPLLPFISEEEWAIALRQSGWNLKRCETTYHTSEHSDILFLLKYIKALGARNKVSHYQTMRGKSWLESLAKHYPKQNDNNLLLDWHILKIHATK